MAYFLKHQSVTTAIGLALYALVIMLFFDDIHRHLHTYFLIIDQRIFLIVWFEKKIEYFVNDLWQVSPSQAFALHEQMVQDIKFRIQLLLPEVNSHGCVPVPYPSSELNEALKDIGLYLYITGQTNLVYATITYWPWQDGCVCCAMNQTCLKQKDNNLYSR